MFQMLAVIALAATTCTPWPAVSDDVVLESSVVDVAEELALEDAVQIAEQEFAAHVAELGLTGAAPLFGTGPAEPSATNDPRPRRADTP